MEKVDVILGLQWGDEGKGKVVDVLTPRYDVVARFQGGPNAGHTLEFDGQKYILRSIPSGIFQGGKTNIIGGGVVVDPVLFRDEAEALARSGHDLTRQLAVSKKAHLILPTHRVLDAAYEAAKGDQRIGTTGKGIGPAYTDKVSRNGLRVGDLLEPDFRARYERAKGRHEAILRSLGFAYDIAELERQWFPAVEYLRNYRIIDSEYVINKMLCEGRSVLAEGAQGTLLDVDFGSYPFVTSSNTVCAGACTGLGVAPNRIGEVYGIFKAYCTRVGSGPFPTELFDETGRRMREIGREYGAVTGRERRCGWLDLVALKYAVMIDGVTQLIMMKADVMNDFDTIRVAVAYDTPAGRTDEFPFEAGGELRPVYREFPGWKCDLGHSRCYDDFPAELRAYVEFIEQQTGVPVRIISVGPDRGQTVVR
ncbi:MAG: adenylosuccinate synthase [Alistipes sp.]|jgi:adenylosuccinate synthase|uniref:adenylosuccinate synthase n=1 Tax=Alistipes sp. TaxID=1872444 RepID=UPI001D7372D7|nr:adenylosuccinate synthase [Alistipes sp.]MBS6099209.1 adenylosuccinate synthase [Alistipes sp.]HJI18404.1 adenylosuccinate synthase [Rikenellaceae bacterium]